MNNKKHKESDMSNGGNEEHRYIEVNSVQNAIDLYQLESTKASAKDIVGGVYDNSEIEWWDDVDNAVDPEWDCLTPAQMDSDEFQEWESGEVWIGLTRCAHNNKRRVMSHSSHNGRTVHYRVDDNAEYVARYNGGQFGSYTLQVIWSKWVMPGRWASPCYPGQATPADSWDEGFPTYSPPPDMVWDEYKSRIVPSGVTAEEFFGQFL